MSFSEDKGGFANREEELKARIESGEVIEKNGAYYVEVNGYLYPVGTEPDPTMSQEELRVAQAKELGWIWAVRFGLLGIAIVIVLIIVFSLTS